MLDAIQRCIAPEWRQAERERLNPPLDKDGLLRRHALEGGPSAPMIAFLAAAVVSGPRCSVPRFQILPDARARLGGCEGS